jgi:predicted phage baseplate assembly protein
MTTSGCRCGCGDGGGCGTAAPATPAPVAVPPGRDAVTHRVGDYGRFLAAMLDRLSGPAHPALRGLTVRTTDDPAVALLDSWAVLGDLLTFYTDRITNEGYLRTATEDESLALLGRLVGDRPRPGVASGTFLAYTLDRDPRTGQDAAVTIPRGARAQSVPGPGEEPQSFETAEDLPARWSWNELQVLRRRPYQLTSGQLAKRGELHVAGTASNIKPGDRLLFVFSAEKTADSGKRALLTVPGVRIDRESGTTVVGLPQPALPSLADLLAELQKWITPGDQDSPNPWPDGNRAVDRFDEDELADLRSDLDTITTPTALADRLAHTVERLYEAEELARGNTGAVHWFAALAEELTDLQKRARLLEPPQPDDRPPAERGLAGELRLATPPGDGGGDGGGDCPSDAVNPALRGLGALLAALRTTPTRPPADARHLARDPRRIYAPGSDLGPQLLAALDPRLREGLYAAWRGVDLTVPLALREVQAMRVTATPFGATAPLRPVYDAQGHVDHYVDWPLTGSKLLTVRIDYDAAGVAPRRAEFAYTEGGSTLPKSFDLPADDGTHDLPPGRIELTTYEPDPGPRAADAHEPGVVVKLRPELPERTIFVSRPRADGRIHVAVGDVDSFDIDLAPGDEPAPVIGGGYKVTLGRTPEGKPTVVEISFSSQIELSSRDVLALDAVYEGIAPGSWVVVERPHKEGQRRAADEPDLSRVVTRVAGVRVISRADFGITGKVTELTLEDNWLGPEDTQLSQIRDTTVHARGETVTLADEPVTGDVHGDAIELGALYDGLTPGRWIVVTGERTDIPGTTGVRGTEPAMVAGVDQSVDPDLPGDAVRTTLHLTASLAFRYKRETVTVLGNVVRATQGATRDEPIGSGDAGAAGQTFTLWQGPLTWLAADTPSGAESTLRIRVDGVPWTEVDSLAGRGPTERVYVTGTTGDGRTTVTFGDGVHGARLPTGHENVRATYRVGVGKSANVPAGRVTQLTTRPLGVTAVTNPLPATGGADPDGPGLAARPGLTPGRARIPLAVRALDRLVCVEDYADFTRTRAGIGRASAVRLNDGAREIVHVTVAGVDDIPLAPDSDLMETLRASLTGFGDPGLPVRVAVREQVLLVVAAKVALAPGYAWDTVEPRLRAALLARFGFAGRDLGQPAHLSEALAAAQAVPGVDHVDVDVFTGVPGDITPAGLERLAERLETPRPVVEAEGARYREQWYRVRKADGETLTEVAAAHGISVAELLRLNPDITGVARLARGRPVLVFRGVRPAQLAVLSPDLPDTLILTPDTGKGATR